MGGMSEAPRSEQFDDVYFSAHDGPGETVHVFLDGNNLPAAWQDRQRFVIGETGFGTGLNFLLAWELFERTAPKNAFLDFISIEKYPLSAEAIAKGLSPWADRLSPYLGKLLHQYPLRVPGFHRIVFDGRVALTLIFDDVADAMPEIDARVDAWFLDGFTPAKNPDMWREELFNEMARLSHAGTSFSTFTAAGFVKRGLQAAGFSVEKRKGFGPKRDMLAGTFIGPHSRTLPAQRGSVAIHGAGLAGCAAAHVLRQYGYQPALYDPGGIASGASGNPLGLINPRLSARRSAQSDFFTAGFALARRCFMGMDGVSYRRQGALHLLTDEIREKRFRAATENWGWGAAMRMVDAAEAGEIARVPLRHGALFLPDAGLVDPAALCRSYAAGIELSAAPPQAEHILHASGAALAGTLPVQTVRGQMTIAAANELSARLAVNLCYGGYLSAPVGGHHAVGATFQKWLTDRSVRGEDDEANLAQLHGIAPELSKLTVRGARAALRTTAPDRFPIIGPWGGVFVSTAYGSHGITGSLTGAHLIADFLRGGPFSLGKKTMKALAPSRYLDNIL